MWWVIFFTTHPGFSRLTVLVETTKGVYQASGYGDLASDKSIWFVLHLGGSLFFQIMFYRQVLVFCGTQKP